MKKLITVTLGMLLFTGCSSLGPQPEEMKKSPKCMVWQAGPLGTTNAIEVEGELAQQKQTCWLFNMWACSYTDYKFRSPTSNEILSSLPPEDKTIGRLDGSTLSPMMTGATIDPFPLKDGKGHYVFQGPLGTKSDKTIEYNSSCSVRQAALGTMTLFGK